MVEPNYNLIKFIRRCIYQMKREYGGAIQINVLGSVATDYETGVKSAGFDSYDITRAVVLPVRIKREVIQTISMISANKKFVQGGTYETGTRTFIIDRRDCPGLTAINNEDWIVYDGKRYELKWIDEFEQGTAWLVIGKELAVAPVNRAWNQSLVDAVSFTDVAGVDTTSKHGSGTSGTAFVSAASGVAVYPLLTANGGETFNGVVTKSGGPATTWDFGDSTDATGNTVNHAYSGAGTYSVQWDVADANLNTLNTTNSGVTAITTSDAWTNMTELDVSDNGLTSLTTHTEWTALEKLIVGDNTISTLTTYASWTAMTDLNADRCGLSSLTIQSAWTSLVNVSAVGNASLTSVTTSTAWTALETMNLASCGLTTFTPRSEWSLTDFNVSNNSLTSLTTYGWTTLERFDVHGNNSLGTVVLWAAWSNITYIDVGLCGLTSLTARSEWSDLEFLDCSNNVGIGIFTTHSTWTKVKELYLDNIGVSTLTGYAAWTALEALHLNNNSLTAFTTQSAWTALTDFRIHANAGLTSITAHSAWTSLASFWAYNCNLSTCTIPAITSLLDIRVQNNNLAAGAIDTILINCDTAGGSNGALNYSGNPGSADVSRSGAAATAKSNLISNGWTITI